MLLHVGDTTGRDEVKVPKPPGDWVDPAPNIERGGATFDKVDNPGGWSIFSYLPDFFSVSKGGQCKFNCLQDVCHTVPPNEDKKKGGRRGIRRWCEVDYC